MTGNPHSRRDFMRGAVMLGVGAATGGFTIAGLADPALAAVAAPTIASCATWGARDPLPLTEITTPPNKILVHHTATANSTDYSQAHAFALARSIQDYHMDTNGWSDSGQHFTISRGGYAMEGRHYSLSHLQSGSGMVVGAHCPGQNDQAIGIENEGTYSTVAPTTALYDQLVKMCAYICDRYKIPATEIYGHRDFRATECPGDVLYSMLPQLRLDVAAVLNPFTVTVDNSSTNFSAGTNWGTSTYSTQRYGTDYRYANPATGTTDYATYKADIPANANYKIEVWYPALPGYNPSTPFIVYASGGNQTKIVNQTANGGMWNSLGTFALTAGTAKSVVSVSRASTGTGYVIADAVRITKI